MNVPPHRTASTAPAARNGPKGRRSFRVRRLVATSAIPTTEASRKPRKRATATRPTDMAPTTTPIRPARRGPHRQRRGCPARRRVTEGGWPPRRPGTGGEERARTQPGGGGGPEVGGRGRARPAAGQPPTPQGERGPPPREGPTDDEAE